MLVHKDDDEDIDSFESDGDAGEAKDGHLPEIAIESTDADVENKEVATETACTCAIM